MVDVAAVEVADADPLSDEVAAAHDAYFAELAARFPSGFDPGDTALELSRYRPPHGAVVVARLAGRVIGTAALAPLRPDGDDEVPLPLGEVKRMWVAADARGLGLGRRLLEAIEERARELGYATLRLDTNETLEAALGLYAAAGYHRIERYNDNRYATHFLERSLAR